MATFDVLVENNHPTDAIRIGRTVSAIINHASLVSAGLSRSDAADISVLAPITLNQHAAWVENAGGSSARVWWSLAADIPAGGSAAYQIQHGDLTASPPNHPIEAYSQWDPRLQSVTDLTAPFRYWDDFTQRVVGGEWVPYPAFGIAPDSALYDTVGAWTVESGGVISAVPNQSAMLVVKGLVLDAVRVRVSALIPSDATLPAAGVIAHAPSDVVTGLSCGIGIAATQANVTSLVGGSVTAQLVSQGPNFLGSLQLVQASVSRVDASTSAVIGTVGQTLTPRLETTSANAAGRVGVVSQTVGSSPVGFGALLVEAWDSVPLGFVVTTPSLPSLSGSLPCTAFRTEEVIGHPTAILRGDYSRHQAIKLGPKGSEEWRVSWPLLTASELSGVRAQVTSTGNGASDFEWTPPSGVASRYRVVPGSFRYSQRSAVAFSAELALEEVSL